MDILKMLTDLREERAQIEEPLLILETNRMDEEQRDASHDSGEFIFYLDLRPKSDNPELVYEPLPGRMRRQQDDEKILHRYSRVDRKRRGGRAVPKILLPGILFETIIGSLLRVRFVRDPNLKPSRGWQGRPEPR
ncbi:MAG TPA: hypothetical protein VGG72_21015 [Bryobacteraceae bacterium]|jgi:hypothetical protein